SDGFAMFWYKGSDPCFYVLVCDAIQPVMAYHNTVDYWKKNEANTVSDFYIVEFHNVIVIK
ncbi:MAG: hypothetical protein RIS64_2569, partial [Bacteroidota bacterium]